MSVNNMTFQQSAAVLNEIVKQATGRSSLATTEPDFISVAQTALNLGKDAIFNALTNVLARTIFSIRPYSASMTGLEKDMPTWGAYMRKLNIIASDWKDNPAYKYPVTYDASETSNPLGNGLGVDPWVINKREYLQTNFLGQAVFNDHYTVFEEQLETAFRNSGEFGSFMTMTTTDMNNKLETVKENVSRSLVSNLIASLVAENNSDRVVHLLSLYNSETGGSFTATSIRLPDNYPAFMKWAYAKIASIASMFRENSMKYQTIIDSKPILKHTPYNKQKMYMLAGERYAMDARVLADTFHDNYLKYADVETLNFWQSINTPATIQTKPTYTSTAGAVVTASSAVTVNNVFAVLFDEDAMGWAIVHKNIIPTPLNPGEYRNMWYNMRIRCFEDNCEKAVVFLLD